MYQVYRIGEHMKKNITRLMILGVLIVLCIWQTITLWLGDMSGHNFFADDTSSYEISYVRPKQIWGNVGGSIYKMAGYSEKENLLSELVTEIRKANLNIELSPKEEYSRLLYDSQGIIYEFGTELSIDEIIGKPLDVRGSKYNAIKIKEIYVDLSTTNNYKSYVYLIDKEACVRQKITIENELRMAKGIIHLYSDKESMASHKLYQASITNINDSKFLIGNAIYPQMNSSMPQVGTVFTWQPIIENIEGKELENYVNHLFRNPSYKTKNTLPQGIAFSDNLNISVKYHNVGTLEFKKTLVNNNEKLTDIEKLNKVNTFIQDCEAIPQVLSKGLYLESIQTNHETKETSYQFGYRYENGLVVLLSQEVKEKLGINAFLELVIKNSEIVSGKWMMLEPSLAQEEINITTESIEAINQIYENSGLLEMQDFALDGLECAYIVKDIHQSVDFDWVGFYKGQPILPVEKIDNE